MAATDLSPNVDNYYIGKGILKFRPVGYDEIDPAAAWRDLGNIPEFEFTSAVERLDHFSSREGVRSRDKSSITQKTATVRLVLEEWTGPNLAMWLLGEQTGADQTAEIDIMTLGEIVGELQFVGTNEVGPKWNFYFPRVSFAPSGSLSPITEEWGSFEVTGEASVVNGRFGLASRDITALPE